MDDNKEVVIKQKWSGLSLEEFSFDEIEDHINLQARSGGSACCCSVDCFTTLFC